MAERRELVEVSDLDPRFPDRILSQPGGECLRACFQCGLCTASCPISLIDSRYSPRRVIKRALLGMRDQVLRDKFIWLCSACFLCQERCPQDVRPPEAMTVLKNMAVKAGIVPVGVAKMMEIFKATGRLYPIDDFTADEREELSLPRLQEEQDTVKRILEG
ncbi:MAG: 4Fe-4S dicluster domain-containing protein [Candidatus Bathyarchaeia archaeon]